MTASPIEPFDEGAQPDPLMTYRDVVAYTRLSLKTVTRAACAKDGEEPALRSGGVGSRRVFRKSDVDAWLFPEVRPRRRMRAVPTPVDPRSRRARPST